jgi:hypothetical protein
MNCSSCCNNNSNDYNTNKPSTYTCEEPTILYTLDKEAYDCDCTPFHAKIKGWYTIITNLPDDIKIKQIKVYADKSIMFIDENGKITKEDKTIIVNFYKKLLVHLTNYNTKILKVEYILNNGKTIIGTKD